MMNWKKRVREWYTIARLHSAGAPFAWWVYAITSVGKMARALLSGPVPRDAWQTRIRICLRCPVLDRELMACRRVLPNGTLLGCSCYVPMLALTAAPYPRGCWAHNLGLNEGWPAYVYKSTLAKIRAVFRFFTCP